GVAEGGESARGPGGPRIRRLGEDLARLDLGRLARRAEDPQLVLVEMIDDALDERLLGADDGQADALLLDEGDEPVEVVDVQGDVAAVASGAGVTRGTIDPLDPFGLGQLPDQGVLATALADDQDLHRVASFSGPRRRAYQKDTEDGANGAGQPFPRGAGLSCPVARASSFTGSGASLR